MTISFLLDRKPVAIAKDGADLPPQQVIMEQAIQTITVGETRDFEWQPDETGNYTFEERSGGELFVK